MLRRMVARVLTDLGYRVLLSCDGEEALRKFEAHAGEIDLLILDMVMPRLSGAECYRSIKRLKPAACALLITGYATDGALSLDPAAGDAPALLRKPFGLDELAVAVRSCLDGVKT
jgi:CheY-like chemotaxis protein